jgi:hypothetical protein
MMDILEVVMIEHCVFSKEKTQSTFGEKIFPK